MAVPLLSQNPGDVTRSLAKEMDCFERIYVVNVFLIQTGLTVSTGAECAVMFCLLINGGILLDGLRVWSCGFC